jgi:hypothetical protein
MIFGKSKMVGRGAERLATPNVQGVYHQSLPGPSVHRVLVGAPTPGELAWIEGSVEAETRHDHSNVVQQGSAVDITEHEEQVKQAEEPFRTPQRLKEQHRALLAATQTGTVRRSTC